MATPVFVDPADEAGGEIVYTDDGLAPAVLSKPPLVGQPPRTGGGGGAEDDGDVVSSTDYVSPQLAFEVFQGKIYSASSQQGSTGNRPTKEPPMVRLARLQQELNEIEAQLSASTTSSTSSIVAGTGQAFDEPLVALATTLQSQLTALASHRILDHDDLTRLIRQQLESLKVPLSSTTDPKTSALSSSSSTSETGIVYELYGTATNPTTMLEDRLVRLERAVGGSLSSSSSSASATTAGSTTKTLLRRLEEMEQLVKTVDATTMEQTATKAKIIRADLEAASKARNKLAATYKKEDSKMIQELHTQLMELEGMSEYLPALVERLQQLASLHVQAGTFSSRLEALETSANQLSSSVSSVEATMEQLTSNLTQNLTTMESNLQALDKRLKEL